MTSYPLQIRKVVDISGRVEVTFDNLAKDLGLAEDYTRQVVFDVHVKEENTERIQVCFVDTSFCLSALCNQPIRSCFRPNCLSIESQNKPCDMVENSIYFFFNYFNFVKIY